MKYFMMIVSCVFLISCNEQSKGVSPEFPDVCENAINGVWESQVNGDQLTLDSNCTGKFLACQQEFYFENPGPNNLALIYSINAGVFAQCNPQGYNYCQISLSNNDDRLAVQCTGQSLVVYDRIQ
jgi:hypothetical protein